MATWLRGDIRLSVVIFPPATLLSSSSVHGDIFSRSQLNSLLSSIAMRCEEVIVGEDDKARESARDITLPEAIVIAVNSDAATTASCGSGGAEVSRTDAPASVAKAAASTAGEAEGNVETETVKAKAVDLEMGGASRDSEGEKGCRICHLCAEMVGSAAEGWELIEIGCVCKGDLGMAHRHCAEAWFRAKGNRVCEICGVCAKNIVPKEDRGFMEVWHEGRRRSGVRNGRTLPGRNGYWNSQRFCSFLVSFLVIAFVLQWYFRESF